MAELLSNDNWVNVQEVLEEIRNAKKLSRDELTAVIMGMQWMQGAKAALTGYKHLSALKEADLQRKEEVIRSKDRVIKKLDDQEHEWHRSCMYWRDEAMKLGWKKEASV